MSSFLLVLLSLSFNSFALEGVITVLSAPAWKKPDTKSAIVQYFRRGETVTIIDQNIINSDYVPIWDNLAKPAYIRAQHVKVYWGTPKELEVKRIDDDPTDYRLNEPMPANRPIPNAQDGKNSPFRPLFKKK